MSLSSVPSIPLKIHYNVKGFSTKTAICCRGKVNMQSVISVYVCMKKKAKVLKQEVRSEDDLLYRLSRNTHSPQQCFKSFKGSMM